MRFVRFAETAGMLNGKRIYVTANLQSGSQQAATVLNLRAKNRNSYSVLVATGFVTTAGIISELLCMLTAEFVGRDVHSY